MKSTTYLVALFTSFAIAAPTSVDRTSDDVSKDVCEALEDVPIVSTICELSTALCCDSKATEATSLKCVAPSTAPFTIAGFEASCLVTGKKHPRCCVLDLSGLVVSCD
ncbi:hypothetical protein CGRA01v4_10443 [Colletotrichum graminicola]|uniref:Fungal hydrophobin n=1 Tax=Colletotrichum graminicola (strain M1.001 / M2 / FGSC 10212) TaxID=645133 RepID=E3R014_COLGM|nr:uncharacterized protein GLRG_11603 [Colletotrichum graminicola M1.001]EFQ36458.1 hypothetical protein GLRG_11603 [Colletotrichum graminicola M1.001]WDK19156.1 hypothetical protein CGRA01v4_10443 [Colletotrichum graminicola]